MTKKIVVFVAVVSLIFYYAQVGNVTGSYAKQRGAGTGSQEKDYIIGTKNVKPLADFEKRYGDSGEINGYDQGKMKENEMLAVRMTDEEAEELKEDSDVLFVEENQYVEGSTSQGNACHEKKVKRHKKNESATEWNVRMIKANGKKSKGKKKKEKVKVAVLDSGVDYGNDIELAATITLIPGEEEMSPLFMDGSGHGNGVAGLIAAEDNDEGITGINPDVELYSIRILDNENRAPVSRVIEGIYMAMEQGVNIINMSFGMNTYSAALEKAVQDAADAGILIVAAAGNTGKAGVQYPAAYNEVMAVGSVDKMGDVAPDSATGPEVEIVAPGELVRTTGTFGDQLVTSGTSFAAPQVSAVASLIWQQDLNMSADFIRWAINEGANSYGETEAYGNGLIDAEYILTEYQELKDGYESGETEAHKKNESEIIAFEDTGCVEGNWTKKVHEGMVASDYPNVKAGGRFPDYTDYTGSKDTYGNYRYAKISNNPWWHGSYQQSNNYVAAYIYATNMANAIGQGKMPHDAAVSSGFTHATDMLWDVNAIGNIVGWNHKYVLNQKEPTAARRRAFVWGMAIHTLSDTFAHSAYVHDGSGWHHLAHNDGKGYDVADNPDKYKHRKINAEAAVKKSIAVYNNKYAGGTYKEFSTVIGQSEYRLRDISSYIKAVAGSAAAQPYVAYSYSPSTNTK